MADRNRVFGPEEERLIVHLYVDEHLSGPQIRDRFGKGTHRSIYAVLNRAGVERPHYGVVEQEAHEKTVEQVVRLYTVDKLPGPEIKQRLGLKSVTTVYSALKEAGIERPSHGVRGLEDQESLADKVVALWNQDKSYQDIRDTLGVSVTHIYRILNKAGFHPAHSGKREQIIRSFSPEQEGHIVALYQQGTMAKPLADRFQCSPHTIRNVLDRHGIESRYDRATFTEDQVADILDEFQHGKSPQEIADWLNVRVGYVSTLLHNRLRGQPHGLKRAERIHTDIGYTLVYVDRDSPYYIMAKPNSGGLVLEHRLVMAQQLGRPLDSTEEVHHRDGNRANNDPTNLELWLVRQPRGQRVNDLITFLVEHYPDEVMAAYKERWPNKAEQNTLL